MRIRTRGRMQEMPRWRLLAPVAFVAAVVLALSAVVVAELRAAPTRPATAIQVSSGTWGPFVGPELPGGGPLAELVTEVLRRQGYSPEISYTSWPLAQEQAAGGETIGVFPLVGSDVRREEFLLSDPLLDFQYVLFYDRRRPTPQVLAPEDLRELRVGQVAGYDYWAELEDAVTEFIEYPSSLEAFRALADGEIDLLPEGLLSGRAVLDDSRFAFDASDFAHLEQDSPLVSSTEALHFMVRPSPATTQVVHDVNVGLARLRATGEYDDVVAGLGAGTADTPVTLSPLEDGGLVELLDADGALALLAPRGTRARVLDWPDEFLERTPAQAGRLLVRVKLLNGPAQGRVFRVDARALVLSAAG